MLMLFMGATVSALDMNWYDAHATFYGDMGGGETMRKSIICLLSTRTFLNIRHKMYILQTAYGHNINYMCVCI